MNRKIVCVIIFFINILNGFPTSAQAKITVAVAANMQYTIEALKSEFKKISNAEIDVVVGASGNLTQQIITGRAPFDIFISADTSYPQKIFDKQLAAERPKIYARGLLVIWTVRNDIIPGVTCKFLLANNIKSIAIANPETAPYGAAAVSLLKKYKLYKSVSAKLVTGESITQTSQLIATQSADAGFTAKAIVVSNEMKGKGKWIELPKQDYPAIFQSAVLLSYGSKNTAAKKFFYFLYSAKAKDIYKKYGYIAL